MSILTLVCVLLLVITVRGFGPAHIRNRGQSVARTSSKVVAYAKAQPSAEKIGAKFLESLNGSDVRVGIIRAAWNKDIIDGLYDGVNASLTEAGVKPSNVFTTNVPGAFELPVTAKLLAASKRVDVIICLGCLIKGDTMHFEYIAGACANGIMQVSTDTMVPCLFGVLTVLDKEQAIKRSSGDGNEGLSWGKSAVEMGLTRMSALGFLGGAKAGGANEPNPAAAFPVDFPKKGAKDDGGGGQKKIGF
jgi:6,7-dimethyl-8-ribityllumazine synthase